MVQSLSLGRVIRNPRLLLVHARLLQEHGLFEDAIEKASVARAIAEHDLDEELIAGAMLVAGECYSEIGDYAAALELLGALAGRPSTELTLDQRAWAYATMAGCCVHLGREGQASAYAAAAESTAHDPASSQSVRSYVSGMAGAIASL